ncbi:hypothetical protein ACN9MZ_18525 [Pseudoduganella sp. S-14]|uniref:hypothetical protein n=1 Tax=Pseudoduganella sp. S-14 TaxID=3404065 RepID=UPI003CF13E5F
MHYESPARARCARPEGRFQHGIEFAVFQYWRGWLSLRTGRCGAGGRGKAKAGKMHAG